MVKYPPSVGRYKVYIIDEVHMLSQAAENAFLKTLEEPPEHAVFILATTDPQKVRSTIRSRCMQLNFKRVSEQDLIAGMDRICSKRGISVTKDALTTIALRADGSVRDALSILEQCIAAGDKTLDRSLVLEYAGAAGEDFFLALTDAVIGGDTGKIFVYIDEIIRRGKDARQILKDWLNHYRNLMVVKYVAKPDKILGSSSENISRLSAQADRLRMSDIEKAIRLLSEYINLGRYSERPRILLETAAVRLSGADQAPAGRQQGGEPGRFETGSIEPSQASIRRRQAEPQIAGSQARQMGSHMEIRTEHQPGVNSAHAERADAGMTEEIEMITSAPREKAGDPVQMWSTIVGEISRNDRSFNSFVGRHSRGAEYEAGELTVIVRPGKLRIANDKLGDITRTAKGLYGSDVFVTLRGGDPSENSKAAAIADNEAAVIIDEDVRTGDVISDVEDLFGIRPEIKE